MGLRFNREDARLGAIPVGSYVTSTSTTPAPTGLPNHAIDWEVLPSGTVGQVLTVNADGSIAWSSTGSGSVTSVTFTGDGTVLSSTPSTAVTASGTVTAALATQAKNTILAGPSTGANAAPTFRALAQADITPLSPLSSPGSGTNSEQFGATASASNTLALAIGHGATAAGVNTLAIGNATVSADHSMAIGYSAGTSTFQNAMAVGYNAQAGATGAFAFGYNSSASGAYATGLGYGTVVAYAASIGLGANATPTVANQLMLGGAGQYISNITTYAGTGGTTVNLGGYSSGTPTQRTPGIIQSSFNTSADATWSGNLLLYAGDYTSTNAGKRLGVQIQSNGSAALVGFFGATPVVQPIGGGGNVTNFTAVGGTTATSTSTWTGSSGASTYTVGDIVTALKALGILTP